MADAAEVTEEQGGAAPAGPPGMLRDRYVVRSNQPLSDLSTPNAEAFVAEDKRDPKRPLFALICRPDLPPRVNVMRAIKGVLSPGMIQLVEWGPMTWAPAGRQCMTVIYERPVGKRLMTSLRGECRRVDEYVIIPKVVEPLVAAIRELTQRGITHRAIRATNLFFMDESGDRIALGDCVTSPPAFDQPLVFETIESGMANGVARGSGTFSDDLYSLGVTLVFLLLGRNPVGHLDEEQLLRYKVQQGSYSTLVGDERLPLAFVELLRGLLCDDPDMRWDLESLDLWLSGRRLSPLQTRHEKRAARGFPFNGKEYFNCRELAAAMARNWEAAIPPVLEGKLELWLRRAVEDKDRASAVAEAVRLVLNGGGDKRIVADLMLCKVLTLLDPTAPIRYKGFNAMPDGVGSALAAVMAKKSDTRLLAEVMLREVPKLWFEGRLHYTPDNSMMEGNFRELKNYLGQTGMGFGLERCLYEMNDALPCQSPLVGEEYVVELRQLLPALNAAAAKRTDFKQWPVDRHVAAFMGARARSDIDRNLLQLSDPDPARSFMALLNLFAVFQYRLGPEQLPGLAAWVGALAAPVVAAFHSRDKRKELEKEIPKLIRRGSVVEIYNLLENPGEREKDENDFAWAQAQYHAAEEEIKRVQNNDEDGVKEAIRLGKQTAAVLGILVALITTSIVVIMKVW
jgi:Serine/threonine protein kinase